MLQFIREKFKKQRSNHIEKMVEAFPTFSEDKVKSMVNKVDKMKRSGFSDRQIARMLKKDFGVFYNNGKVYAKN